MFHKMWCTKLGCRLRGSEIRYFSMEGYRIKNCHPCAGILKMRQFWFLNLPSTRDWAVSLNQSGTEKFFSWPLIGLKIAPSHVYLVNWEIRNVAFWEFLLVGRKGGVSLKLWRFQLSRILDSRKYDTMHCVRNYALWQPLLNATMHCEQ